MKRSLIIWLLLRGCALVNLIIALVFKIMGEDIQKCIYYLLVAIVFCLWELAFEVQTLND